MCNIKDMKKKILFYQSTFIPEMISSLINIIKDYNMQCVIVNSKSAILDKINDINILICSQIEATEIKALYPCIEKKIIFCTPDNLINTINFVKQKELYISSVYTDISSFFEYINMPPFNTSYILLKHTLMEMHVKKLQKCTYSTLFEVCNKLGYIWKHEQSFLRKSIKDWQNYQNKKQALKYPTMDWNDKKVLNFINNLKQAYDQTAHTNHESVSIYLRSQVSTLAKHDNDLLMSAFKQPE